MFTSIQYRWNKQNTAESRRLKIYVQNVHHLREHIHLNDYATAQSLMVSVTASCLGAMQLQRVQYKLAVMVHRCLGRRAPSHLADYCVPVSTVPGRQHLRSASRRQLIVPRVRRSIFGAWAFAIAGPTVWNSLPDSLRDPAVGSDQFRRDLKMHLFEWHCVSFSALAVFSSNALYKSTFYFYLLTGHRPLYSTSTLLLIDIIAQRCIGKYNYSVFHIEKVFNPFWWWHYYMLS